MLSEYSIEILKEEMNELKMKKNSIKNDDGGWHVIDSDAEIRQIDQQINDLKYSINHLKNQK